MQCMDTREVRSAINHTPLSTQNTTTGMSTQTQTQTQTQSSAPAAVGRLNLNVPPHLLPSFATANFPCTTDIDASPLKDAQTGPTRTMMPVFNSLEEERRYRKEHLALVFRIFHRFKLAEGIAGELPARSGVVIEHTTRRLC